jgi:hypothetical protein
MAELHRVHSGEAEVPSLLLIAEALKALNRPAQAIRALEAASQRAPDNRAIVQRLDETRRATGILLRRVATEPEAEPPRACVRSARLGQSVDSWEAVRIGERSGRIVWRGSADIPSWQADRSAHTGAANARRARRIRPRSLRTDGPRWRRHPERADRRADDRAHRFRAHDLARYRWADGAGAELL